MHLPALIQDLAVILGLAAAVAIIFRKIRQPPVLGYLIAGMIVGPYTPPFSLIIDSAGVQNWADLGVIFLMFSLGLEFSFSKLREVGFTAAVAGPSEAVFMMIAGFLAGRLGGWNFIECLFLGAILSISSTTIILKTFEDMGVKNARFAQLTFGVLVVEDLVAILLLIGLSSLVHHDGLAGFHLLLSALQLLAVVGGWIVIGRWTLPWLMRRVAKSASTELLTLLSLSLCLGMVVLSAHLHYSSALGAFIAGALIGEIQDVGDMEALVRPFRDVFAAVFFVSIGMLMDPSQIRRNWVAIVGFTALTVVGKIFSTALAVRVSGEDLRTSLRVGFSLAQIGEFSFIIAGVGVAAKAVHPEIYTIAVAVCVATTFLTPYLIRLAGRRTSAVIEE